MKKTLSILVLCPSLSLSTVALAAEHSTGEPNLFGNLNFGVTKVEDSRDIDGEAFEASLGVKGKFSKKDFTLLYTLEADFANAANNGNGDNEVHIKNATAVLPTKQGVFVIAPRTKSGQQRELYGKVDIFEVNQANTSNNLWGQPEEATSVFAYVTPKFSNTHLVGAVLTLNQGSTNSNFNDNAVDAYAIRAIHASGDLYLGAGVVSVANEQLPGTEDYTRTAFTASYAFNKVDLALTVEDNKNHPAGDFSVVGAVADIQVSDKWSLGIGYTDKDADADAADNSSTTVIARNQIMEDVFAYAEVADYDLTGDNYSVGLNISF